MKKLLLFYILSLFALHTSHSQEWFPVGAQWTYGWAEYGCVNPSVSNYYPDIYEVEKDTIVLGKACRKIKRSVQINWYGNSETFVFDSAGKIYYFPPFDFVDTREEWSLLYDLTKNKGDTIWYPNMRRIDWNTGDTVIYYNVVDTVFETKVNGQYLTTIYASSCRQLDPNSPWLWTSLGTYVTDILGGGIIGTGTHWAGGCQIPDGLRCYEDSSFGYYKSPWFNLDCDTNYTIYTGIENELGTGLITVYPNPAKNSITIQSEIQNSDKLIFRVFDLNGAILKVIQVDSPKSNIDISQFKSGMYIYEIESDGHFHRDKLIIE